jgi:Mlc titration factor MtfA (ptsG expression regulator)
MILPVSWWKRRKRAHVLEQPFPPAWWAILERNVPAVAQLDREERKTLEDRVRIFLAEKNFEGCGGLALTDEMRVTIAGQACLLLLHLAGDDVFPTVESVLVYPAPYRVPQTRRPGGIVVEDPARAGEAWQKGTVVLAWNEVLRSAHDARHNLVLHEFAHALDQEDGAADGAPVLPARGMYGPWAQVLGAEYEQLTQAIREGRATDIDPYGATDPAEFFAVVTEAFFGQPRQLRSRHPALYEQLRAFYGQDPASRVVP